MRNDVKLCPNGIPFRSKGFSVAQVWYLLVRIVIYTLKRNWILLVIQSSIFIGWAGFSLIHYDFDFDKHFQCVPVIGHSCPKTKQSIESSKIIQFHMALLFTINMVPQSIVLTLTSLTFWQDFKIFIKEYKNCK